MIDVSRFKVIHKNTILNAIAIVDVVMPNLSDTERNKKTITKPKFIEVLAINEDGNLVSIYDEAWTFQFIPIVTG